MARKKKRSTGLRLIKRPGSPYWQITGTVRGTPVRESTGTVLEEHAQKLLRAREDEILDAAIHGPRAVATFARAANLYKDLDENRDSRFVKLLLSYFGDMKIADITNEKIIEFRKLHYPKLSPAGINRQVYTPIIAILNVAHEAGLCEKPSFTRPEIEHKVVKPASDEWIAEFLSKVPSLRLRTIVLLMTTTGCRVAEACRVTWQDIDLGKATILLEMTKNGMPRRLVLGDNVVAALKELKDGADAQPAARVFGFASRWSVRTALRRACKKAGLKYYSSHKLGRHACATRLLAHGHTLGETAAALGWAKASIPLVHKVYGHLEQSKLDDAVRTCANSLGVTKRAA